MEDLGNENVRVSGRPPGPLTKASVATGVVMATTVPWARASGLSSDRRWKGWRVRSPPVRAVTSGDIWVRRGQTTKVAWGTHSFWVELRERNSEGWDIGLGTSVPRPQSGHLLWVPSQHGIPKMGPGGKHHAGSPRALQASVRSVPFPASVSVRICWSLLGWDVLSAAVLLRVTALAFRKSVSKHYRGSKMSFATYFGP